MSLLHGQIVQKEGTPEAGCRSLAWRCRAKMTRLATGPTQGKLRLPKDSILMHILDSRVDWPLVMLARTSQRRIFDMIHRFCADYLRSGPLGVRQSTASAQSMPSEAARR